MLQKLQVVELVFTQVVPSNIFNILQIYQDIPYL